MTTPQGGQGGFNLGNAYGKVLIDASQVQQGLSQAERQIQGFGQRMAGAFDGIGASMQGIGTQLTVATAPLAAMGAVGVRTAATFQDSMAEISARTGATGEALDAIRNKALQLGADTQFSAQQASEAFLQLLTSGSSVEEAMQQIDAVLAGAAASGSNLGFAADALTDVMAAFGLEASQSEAVMQTLIDATGSSSATFESLVQGFANVGPMARNMGLSVEDTAAVLAVFSENGIKGAEAGTQLRSMLNNMTRDTPKVTGMWEELGISMFDANGQARNLNDIISDLNRVLDGASDARRTEVITTLAGTFGQMGLSALLATGGIEDMVNVMSEQASMSELAEKRMATFNGQLTSLQGSIETLMISAFTPILEILTPVISKMIEAVNAVREWTIENPELTTKIIGFGAALVALGPILWTVGTALRGVGFIIGTLANPIGIAIAATTALYVAFETNFLGIRDLILTRVVPVFQPFIHAVDEAFDAIRLGVRLGMPVLDIIQYAIGQAFGPRAQIMFIDFRNTIAAFFLGLRRGLNVINAMELAIARGFGADAQLRFIRFRQVMSDTFGGVVRFLQNAIQSVRMFIYYFTESAGSGVGVFRRIQFAFNAAFGGEAAVIVTRAFSRIQRVIERVMDAVTPMFKEIGTFISRLNFTQHIDSLVEWGMNLYALTNPIGILSSVLRMFHVDVLSIFERLTAGITGFFEALNKETSVLTAVEYAILQAFGDTGRNAFIRFRDTAQNAFNTIHSAVQTAIPIVQGIIAGLGDTIASLWARISPHLQRFGNWFLNDTLPAVGGVVESSGGLINALADTIVDLWNTVRPHLANFGDWFLNSGLPAIGNVITDTVLPQIEDFIDVLTRLWTDFSPYAVQMVDWFLNDALPRVIEFVNMTVVPAVEYLRDLMAGIWDAVQPALNSLYEWFVNTGMPFIVTTITDGLTAGIQLVIDILSTIWNVVSGPLNAFKDGIVATIGWITNNVIQPLIDSLETAVRLLGNLQGAGDLVGQAGTIAEEAGNVGIGEFFGIVGRSILNQFRADGGPVSANNPYIVGERGPELFVPNSSGGIVPNEALGGPRVDIGTITVHANTPAEGRAAAAALATELESILARSGSHYSMGAV